MANITAPLASPLPPNPSDHELHDVKQGPRAMGLGQTLTTQRKDPEFGNVHSYAAERALYTGLPEQSLPVPGTGGLGQTLTSQDNDPEFGNIKSYEEERALYADPVIENGISNRIEPVQAVSDVEMGPKKVDVGFLEPPHYIAHLSTTNTAVSTQSMEGQKDPAYQEDHETEWKKNTNEGIAEPVDPDDVLYDGVPEEKSNETISEAKVPAKKFIEGVSEVN